MRVAIVHDWLVTYGGAERVLEQMLNVFPEATLYCVADFLPSNDRAFIGGKHTHKSVIQKLPFARTKYRSYLPLMPFAIEQIDLSSFDLVISSCHAVAKGVLTSPQQLHICMCYTPMRYAWDLQHQYLRESGLNRGLRGLLAKWILHKMRLWDYRTANGVDHFIAISNFIERRIWKVYGRKATVIYPPVDTEAFQIGRNKEDFYFTASRMVPYKRVDLIVDAFSQMPDKKLVVMGDGPEFKKIRRKAADNVVLLGRRPFDVLKEYMQKARAFVFGALEDFGIAPVEAQASGTPVIAYGIGGAAETVVEGRTGVFFREQTISGIIDAVKHFEEVEAELDPNVIRESAMRFSVERFQNEFRAFVNKCWTEFSTSTN